MVRFRFITLVAGLMLFSAGSVAAQCQPDTNITGNVPGIYPDSATGLPHAFVGVDYSTTIQLKVVRDTTYLSLPAVVDSMVITGVTGLPSGFTYSCTPSSCSFPGNSDACILLEGPAPVASQVGAYPITVALTVYGRVLGVPQTLPTTITRYTIFVDNPTSVIQPVYPSRLSVSEVQPNPVLQDARITVGLPVSGLVHVEVYDLLGNKVNARDYSFSRGWNTVQLTVSDYKAGIYLCKVSFGREVISRRMVVTAH